MLKKFYDYDYFYDKVLIFKGEYKNNTKKNELIFEGEYKNGKIQVYLAKLKILSYNKEIFFLKEWIVEDQVKKVNKNTYVYSNENYMFYKVNGKFVDKKEKDEQYLYYIGEYKNEVKHGEGKLYNKFGKLFFIGQFNNGKPFKGKEFYKDKLIFEGEYKNGIKWNGKGTEYNYKDKLIFKGDYKNGIKWNGKGTEYNGWKLIFEGEYKDGKRYKGKEYNKEGKLIFEGEYKDGKKYKRKEYSKNGELIFEGEYKDGIKWNGIFYNPHSFKDSGKLFNGNGTNIKEYDSNLNLI